MHFLQILYSQSPSPPILIDGAPPGSLRIPGASLTPGLHSVGTQRAIRHASGRWGGISRHYSTGIICDRQQRPGRQFSPSFCPTHNSSKSLYKDATSRPLPPAHATISRMTVEQVELYTSVPPPRGEHTGGYRSIFHRLIYPPGG